MSQNELDIRQSAEYDIVINKDRTLKTDFQCFFMSGETEIEFSFATYSGATLHVKNHSKSNQIILNFNTIDGSIVLGTLDNTFQLNKTSIELANLRAGKYYYDMYLSSTAYPKRAFLSGDFIIKDRITI